MYPSIEKIRCFSHYVRERERSVERKKKEDREKQKGKEKKKIFFFLVCQWATHETKLYDLKNRYCTEKGLEINFNSWFSK